MSSCAAVEVESPFGPRMKSKQMFPRDALSEYTWKLLAQQSAYP